MKFDTNTFWGFIFVIFSSLLYCLNQVLNFLLFANMWSEIIFVLLMYGMMTLGIAMVIFDEFWTQAFVGFFSIFFTVLILNASLLLFDAFNTFRYGSTDYFALFKYAIYLPEIPDGIALLLIAIAPTLGILLWLAISYDDVKKWYELPIFALSMFILTIICTASIHLNIFLIS